MKWVKRPDHAWVLKKDALVAVLELPGLDWIPEDGRYDLRVFDNEPGPLQGEVYFAAKVALADGKEWAEEFIADYLDDGTGAPDDLDGWEEPF
jgi:hypothetical protein